MSLFNVCISCFKLLEMPIQQLNDVRRRKRAWTYRPRRNCNDVAANINHDNEIIS